MSQSNQENLMKIQIMICGNQAVGKTSISNQYINESFSNNYNTIGLEMNKKQDIINSDKVNIFIIDVQGTHENFDVINQQARKADGYIFVYDIGDSISFKDIDIWITKIKQIKGDDFQKCQRLLIGNKVDTRQEHFKGISREQGSSKAKNHKMKFIETSAKEGTNIKQAIKYLAARIYQQKMQSLNAQNIQNIISQQEESQQHLLSEIEQPQKPKKSCNCWTKFKSYFTN
ncbi:hypothetical protein ABPG74_000910 [Tetrahymena malaccensis]